MGAMMRPLSRRTQGLDEDEIKGLGTGRVDKWDFRLGELWLCCVWCLGKDCCLTNVAWYTGYWKQGQGFLPGHEFLGWSFCLIGQLDHFPHIVFFTKEDAVSVSSLIISALLFALPQICSPYIGITSDSACYLCCNQRLRVGYVLFLSSLQVTAFLTRPWLARQLLIL